MQLEIDRASRRPLYLQIVEQIKAHILTGVLPVGTKIPPVRRLAEQLGLTRLTVHNAYIELQADGWIEAFVGKGSFVVRPPVLDTPRPEAAPLLPLLRRSGDLGDIMRLAQQPHITSFAQAFPAIETFPTREFNRCVQQALGQTSAAIYGYGESQGEAVLRDQLAVYLLERGVQASPDNIVIVGGAQQGIDIALHALLRPGDAIVVERPTYLGMVERMSEQGFQICDVPMDDAGIMLDALEAVLIAHRPRLLYTVPTFHNPTGVNMSEQRRRAVVELCAHHGVLILEDDIYGLLTYNEAAPLPLKTWDRTGTVIYLTSFSKILMPGLRLGLLAVPPSLREPIVAAKRLVDLQTPPLLQHALAAYLASGVMAGHLRAIRRLYRERRDVLVGQLHSCLSTEAQWQIPGGGLCIWIALPSGVNSLDLYLDAIERGVAFAPGEAFYARQPERGFMRLSWAAHTPEQIEHGVSTLSQLVSEHMTRYRRLRRVSHSPVIPMV